MPSGNNVNIEIKGLEELRAKFAKMKRNLSSTLSAAAQDAAYAVILKPRGSGDNNPLYPPETAANKAGRVYPDGRPMGYYVRGRGWYAPGRAGSYKLIGGSEKMGSAFTVKRIGYGAVIGNTASYAPHVIGENQASRMKQIGWKSLLAVAQESVEKIKKVFDVWVNKALKDSGLK